MSQYDFESEVSEVFTDTLEEMLMEEEYQESYEACFWGDIAESSALRNAAKVRVETTVRAVVSVINKSNI